MSTLASGGARPGRPKPATGVAGLATLAPTGLRFPEDDHGRRDACPLHPAVKGEPNGGVRPTFAGGQLQLGGLTLDITGETTRTYTPRAPPAAG